MRGTIWAALLAALLAVSAAGPVLADDEARTPREMREQASIDSLESALPRAEGRARIDILLDLGDRLSLERPQEARPLFDEALDLSRTLGWPEGEARTVSLLGQLDYYARDYQAAIARQREALSLVDGDPSLAVTVDCHRLIAQAYSRMKRHDETFRHIHTARRLASEQGDLREMSFIANYMGYTFWQTSRLDSALVYYREALALREELGDPLQLAVTNNNIGYVYYQWGEYEAALEHFMTARRLWEGEGIESAIVLANIGRTYRDWGKAGQATGFFRRALATAGAKGERASAGYALLNLGSMFERDGDTDSALVYYGRSFDEYAAAVERAGMASALNAAAGALLAAGDAAQVLDHARRALDIARDINNREEQAKALGTIGAAHRVRGRGDEALDALTEALGLARDIGLREMAADLHDSLSDAFADMGRHREALEHLRARTALRDSIFSEASARSIDLMHMRGEARDREIENAHLRAEAEADEAIIRRNRAIIALTVLMLAVIAGVSVVMHRRAVQRRRMNERLEEANRELTRQRDKLGEAKRGLEEAMSHIKVLSGLVPICSHCKKIRDDDGYWHRVEAYIAKHADASFTHGVCPDCMAKLYDELGLKGRDGGTAEPGGDAKQDGGGRVEPDVSAKPEDGRVEDGPRGR